MFCESSAKSGKLLVSLQSTEALCCFVHGGGGPTHRHRRRAPIFDVPADCPYRKPKPVEIGLELGDKLLHGRHAQTDLVGGHRSVPIESFARGGDPDSAPSAQRAATRVTEAFRVRQFRSLDIRQPVSDRTQRGERIGDRQSRRPLSAGIVRAFDCSGDGNRDRAAAGQEFPSKFAS